STLVMNSGVVVRAIDASNVENAMRASSAVMSCIRTLRAIADANSAAAKLLDHQQGWTRPQKCISASSQRVVDKQGCEDARVEDRHSTLDLVAHPADESPGILVR